MKMAIVGAGSIGGLIGARLAHAGQAEVCALARGATLHSLQTQGWRLRSPDGDLQAPARASDQPAALGVQDVVVLAVKAPALAALAPQLGPMMGPHTLVVPAMNGVPWWFCDRVPGFEGRTLSSIDPQGRLSQVLPASQTIGCVVHASASTPEPGLVQHRMGRGLILGEAWGGHSPRVQALCDVLAHAGFDTTHSDHIRRDIWFKLWGNLTMNPVSALTGATMDQVLADPLLLAFCSQAMREASNIGARVGCPIEQSPEERHAITAKLGAVKTSMLQDVEAGRPIELDAIVTAVHEIGTALGEPMPAISALLGLTRVFGQRTGLYPATAAAAAASAAAAVSAPPRS
ncbi:MAG: 2-dehydropantoate 2-reductase [Burkholderiales bacterium]|nr:2-dehydropantoate 2-reductase [Burkholderiales bacterium]